MRRGLLLALVLMSGCVHAGHAQAVTGPRWLDLSRLQTTDYVCVSGAAGAPCATVADVRIFLATTVKVTP